MAAGGSDVSVITEDYAIIHEIYDSPDAHEQFEMDLERALESECKIIIIEPSKLGDETSKWIQVGNCLHKTAVLTGIGSLLSPFVLPSSVDSPVSIATGSLSVFCSTLYGVSWQFDPCCKYQIEYDALKLASLPLQTLTTTSPVVLVRKDDKYRKRLHNFVSGCTVLYLGWRFYTWINS